MGGKASRRKGHDFERSLVRLFKDAFSGSPVTILRGLQAARSFEPDVRLGRFWIEAKVGARPRPLAALDQAQLGACGYGRPGDVPVAVVKVDGQDPVVLMRFKEWIELVQDAGGPKPESPITDQGKEILAMWEEFKKSSGVTMRLDDGLDLADRLR